MITDVRVACAFIPDESADETAALEHDSRGQLRPIGVQPRMRTPSWPWPRMMTAVAGAGHWGMRTLRPAAQKRRVKSAPAHANSASAIRLELHGPFCLP